jgi:Putative zinc-finger
VTGTFEQPEGSGPISAAAAEHARFEFDDAAYLLGALDEEQRQAYERHLRHCPICRDQLSELDELPVMLGRADLSAWEPEPPPDTLLPKLLRQVSADRRRRAWRTGALGVAAACLVAALAIGGVFGWQREHRPQTLVMQSVGPNGAGVYATVQLTGSGSDTRVKLVCGYHATTGSYPTGGTPSYRMVIFNRKGQQVELGSWTPQPDEDVQLARTSPWPRQYISRIEVSDDHGETVLQLSL